MTWSELKNTWKYILNNPLKASLAIGLIWAIITAGIALDKFRERMGMTWGDFFANIGRGFLNLVGTIASVFLAVLGASMGQVLKKVVDGINWIIKQANKLLPEGMKIGKFSAGGIAYDDRSFGDMFHKISLENFEAINSLSESIFGKAPNASPTETWEQMMASIRDAANVTTLGLIGESETPWLNQPNSNAGNTINNYYNVSQPTAGIDRLIRPLTNNMLYTG
jgi:hypothetical protein